MLRANEASLTRTVNVVEGQASTHTADLNCHRELGNDLGGTGHFYDGAEMGVATPDTRSP